MNEAHYHPKTRRMKLNVDRLETLDDVKKILDLIDIRVNTDIDIWEEIGYFFTIECVPRGYLKLIDKIGDDGVAELDYFEMERECKKLLDEEKQNESIEK